MDAFPLLIKVPDFSSQLLIAQLFQSLNLLLRHIQRPFGQPLLKSLLKGLVLGLEQGSLPHLSNPVIDHKELKFGQIFVDCDFIAQQSSIVNEQRIPPQP